jgi:hypothetical protein
MLAVHGIQAGIALTETPCEASETDIFALFQAIGGGFGERAGFVGVKEKGPGD